MEPAMKMTIAIWISSFLLNRSASLPQMGVDAVEASRVAGTTQVYCPWVPRRSVMMVGRAFETTVEDRNATNIASNIPDSASRIWRCVICPCCSARGRSAAVTPVAAAVPSAAVAGNDGRWMVLLTGLLRAGVERYGAGVAGLLVERVMRSPATC